MDKVLFLFLRRMRAPLLVLITAYSISIAGLVLIPGIDDQGQPWRMDFFHAFYFVSYMATTIGFGEIPHAFSESQRMWTAATIYLSVIAWLYAIGKILALVQDPTFKLAVSQQAFDRSIRRLRAPFFHRLRVWRHRQHAGSGPAATPQARRGDRPQPGAYQ
jgi:voltage-gated potassium channel